MISAALFLATLLASAQRPALQTGESIEVSLVNIDAVVTDRAGRRIAGLTAADFELLEDGKPEAISNFTEYSGGPDVSRDETARGNDQRTLIVFIEPFSLPPPQKEKVFAALRQLLRDSVRPGDRATIVEWKGKASVRQQFTDESASLERSLDVLASEYPSVAADAAYELMIARQRISSWLREQARGDPAARRGLSLLNGLDEAERALADMRSKTDALRALITHVAALEGRKSLILVTHRFSEVAGAEFMFNVSRDSPLLSATARSEFNTGPMIESVVASANASGVTIYALYPEGLGHSGMMGAEYRGGTFAELQMHKPVSNFDFWVLTNETPSLLRVSEKTGGFAGWGASSVAGALPRIEDDFRSYYSLAYRVDHFDEDRIRNISVRVRGHPEYVVRSRRAYVNKSAATRAGDRTVANLFLAMASDSIPITVTAGAPRPQRGRRTIPLTVRIPIAFLTPAVRDDRYDFAFSLFVAWSGPFGTPGGPVRRGDRFSVSGAEIERARESHFSFDVEVMVDDQTDRLSVGLLDENSKQEGFAELRLPPR